MKIGKILVQKRQEKKLSQQDVANFLNISQKTYCNYESDKTIPGVEHFFAMAKLLDIDIPSILKEQGIWGEEMDPPPTH